MFRTHDGQVHKTPLTFGQSAHQLLGGERDALGVVPCGRADDAPPALLGSQVCHLVVRAAQLKGKHRL